MVSNSGVWLGKVAHTRMSCRCVTAASVDVGTRWEHKLVEKELLLQKLETGDSVSDCVSLSLSSAFQSVHYRLRQILEELRKSWNSKDFWILLTFYLVKPERVCANAVLMQCHMAKAVRKEKKPKQMHHHLMSNRGRQLKCECWKQLDWVLYELWRLCESDW